jgi:hypothetical protein
VNINITYFFNECPRDYSASVAEIGANAGADTWRAAMECEPAMLVTDEQLDAFRDHVRGFGAWTDAEIQAWTDQGLNALFVQLVSGDMREDDVSPGVDWEAYYQRDDTRGAFYECDGEVFYSLGI